ncbi:hypothetical protein LTS18_003079, partial [Coniosporium uncinatum]
STAEEPGTEPETPPHSERRSQQRERQPSRPQSRQRTQSQPRPSSQSQPVRRLKPGREGIPSVRVLTADEVSLSEKVRSMYDYGDERGAELSSIAASDAVIEEDNEDADAEHHTHDHSPLSKITTSDSPRSASALRVNRTRLASRDPSARSSFQGARAESIIIRDEHEIAGGVEDWTDIEGGDVDRYGFIVPRNPDSRGSSTASGARPIRPIQTLHRISTSLQLASSEPRRKRTMRRASSIARSTRSSPNGAAVTSIHRRQPSVRSSPHSRSIFSSRSHTSTIKVRSSLRHASNRLPHNRERRFVDEASDMLTLPPGLAGLAAEAEGGKAARAAKRKEWSREEKWRKMAKVIKNSTTKGGGGMTFTFDTRNTKLIERTWKGIPDRWRATAWFAFLQSSADQHRRSGRPTPSVDELVDFFHGAQEQSSADDVQIDVDVPRTINAHIMFRRRYRGGQRLLFRVLHALSLFLDDTGYVQGMAAIAATLLCYYDEEKAFVVLARLWMLRGLDHIYRDEFAGLFETLAQFEEKWLEGDVKGKLEEVGVPATSYGTRWYLTLFNYSIPFPAQLRVWDVFMLLGEAEPSPSFVSSSSSSTFVPQTAQMVDTDDIAAAAARSMNTASNTNTNGDVYKRPDLGVLHATSAALVDATREILLDSDFENTMKVLTSWIPIRDEDLLMKVARAEWRARRASRRR